MVKRTQLEKRRPGPTKMGVSRQQDVAKSLNGRPAVLIPYGYTSGYQCLRSLGRHGARTILGLSDETPEAASRYCDETVPLPDPADGLVSYGDALLRIAKRQDVQTIVPLREVDTYVLAKYSARFEEYIDFSVPSFANLQTVHDRLRLVAVAEDAGVPAPKTWQLDEIEDTDRRLIVKSRYNLLADEYVASHSPENSLEVNDIRYFGPDDEFDNDAIRREMNHTPIIQEYIPRGNAYMVGALCDGGEPIVTTQLHQIRENTYFGGGGVYRKTIDNKELRIVAKRLLRELNWHGLACLEYIKDAQTGEFKILEINPRMWQSLPPVVQAGADFPKYYWLHAMGKSEQINPNHKIGVGTHFLKGEMNHLSSIVTQDCPFVKRPSFFQTAWQIASSSIKDPNFDYLHLDDPKPFVKDVYQTLRDSGVGLASKLR